MVVPLIHRVNEEGWILDLGELGGDEVLQSTKAEFGGNMICRFVSKSVEGSAKCFALVHHWNGWLWSLW